MLGLGCRRLGRFGDTIRRVGKGLLHRWDAPAIPRSVGGLRLAHGCRSMGVQVVHGQEAGLPTVGSFRRYHPYGQDAVDDLGTLRRYRGSCVWVAASIIQIDFGWDT